MSSRGLRLGVYNDSPSDTGCAACAYKHRGDFTAVCTSTPSSPGPSITLPPPSVPEFDTVTRSLQIPTLPFFLLTPSELSRSFTLLFYRPILTWPKKRSLWVDSEGFWTLLESPLNEDEKVAVTTGAYALTPVASSRCVSVSLCRDFHLIVSQILFGKYTNIY